MEWRRRGAPGTIKRVSRHAFWDDLARDLDDPEFRRAYVSEAARIAAVDATINAEAASGPTGDRTQS